jgi:tetratricopeptide (TPR) repeat protein
MCSLLGKTFALSLLLAASVAAAIEKLPRESRQSAQETAREHLARGAALERISLYKEAEAEYLAALAAADPTATTNIADAMQRVRQTQQAAAFAQADERTDNYFQLGQELQRRGQYGEALVNLQRAYEEAHGLEARSRAKAAVVRVLEEKNSFWQQYIQEWFKPAFIKIVLILLVIGAFYCGGGLVGRLLARFSRRIEVPDFDDATDSGFGKAFPAILRTAYQQYGRLARRSPTHLGPVLLVYRGAPATLPLMVPPRYQEFSEIELNVLGIEASKLLSNVVRLLRRPYYTVTGAVYRLACIIREK